MQTGPKAPSEVAAMPSRQIHLAVLQIVYTQRTFLCTYVCVCEYTQDSLDKSWHIALIPKFWDIELNVYLSALECKAATLK